MSPHCARPAGEGSAGDDADAGARRRGVLAVRTPPPHHSTPQHDTAPAARITTRTHSALTNHHGGGCNTTHRPLQDQLRLLHGCAVLLPPPGLGLRRRAPRRNLHGDTGERGGCVLPPLHQRAGAWLQCVVSYTLLCRVVPTLRHRVARVDDLLPESPPQPDLSAACFYLRCAAATQQHRQVAVAFLVSSASASARTATTLSVVYVIASGLLGEFLLR